MTGDRGAALLSARNICKQFGKFRALDDVSFDVAPGEVRGLLGANGAGKSTLIGILSGALRPDSGFLSVGGLETPLGSLTAARKAGLSVVHQELMLFPDLTVEENIFTSALPAAPLYPINRRDRRRKVEGTLNRIGATVDLRARVDELPLSHRQLVEIARALCAGGRVLILDEPTSALSQPEARGLFAAIRSIVAEDAAVVFVSHRLDEVFAITDSITVLRDGRVEGHWRTADVDIPTVTHAMVGELADESPRRRVAGEVGKVAIRVSGGVPGLAPLDISVRAGEVVGLAGLQGSGVSTVMRMLGGVVPFEGRLEVDGSLVKFDHPSQAISHGVVYAPPDRKRGGLWLDRSVAFNIGAASIFGMRPLQWLRQEKINQGASSRMLQVGVRANALREPAGRLSGGNQQRILLGRSLELGPRILLLNDFTRGVDVKAKGAIHQLVRELADAGLAICVTSSDLEELLDVADRIICMRGGQVVADQPSATFDKLSLLTLASAAPESGANSERHAAP
jgi:ABC-type sugar transport system ATPase subunit